MRFSTSSGFESAPSRRFLISGSNSALSSKISIHLSFFPSASKPGFVGGSSAASDDAEGDSADTSSSSSGSRSGYFRLATRVAEAVSEAPRGWATQPPPSFATVRARDARGARTARVSGARTGDGPWDIARATGAARMVVIVLLARSTAAVARRWWALAFTIRCPKIYTGA